MMTHTVIKHSQRKDIQGLRALAVLSVVIFHISPANLKGGYLGVDVFFVISGYLIIGQIWRGLVSNEFSFTDFYSKRFRRLFPSFAVVAIATTFFAYMMMLPEEYKTYIHSLIASSLYVSNYWFYSQSGYFANALEFAPLLHTWSLSVEEQFYLIFPLIIFALFKRLDKKRLVLTFLFALGLVSLIISEVLLSYDQTLSFYFSPTRFWQFILGGMLNILALKVKSGRLSQACTLLGIIVLCSCFYMFDETTLFPGLNALPISLATALIIYAHPRKGLGALLLNNRLATYIGNTSYSLYLWHWPVIVFYKLYTVGALSIFEKILTFGVSLALADLTYRFVETKYRAQGSPYNSLKTIYYSAAGSALIIIFSLISSISHSFRFTETEVYLESFLDYDSSHYRRNSCFLTKSSNHLKFYNKDVCVTAQKNKRNILLIGDSHSAMWFEAMKLKLRANETLTQVSASGCRPVIPLKGSLRCRELVTWAYQELLNNFKYEKIIIAGRWRSNELEKVRDTIEFLKMKVDNIEIFGPIIEYNTDLPRLLISKDLNHERIHAHSFYSDKKSIDHQLAQIIEDTSATYISLLNIVCDSNTCTLMTDENVPMQFDYGHLTLEGSVKLLDKIYPNGLL
jgi:peptidoglycan/LPS O-acetylase OafA/YrhL